jgi:protein SCO1/2
MIRFSFFPALLVLASISTLVSCNSNSDSLPVLGKKTAVVHSVNGVQKVDSVDYTIPNFSFINQDGKTITQDSVKGKVYVADFFFASCPSICPKMKAELIKVNEKFGSRNDFVILSHSIDPKRDSVPALHKYVGKLGLPEGVHWHFLTGIKDSIYKIADSYLISAAEDANAPGGLIHSGNFILIDKHRRIRAYYDGTNSDDTEKLLRDIELVLNEK